MLATVEGCQEPFLPELLHCLAVTLAPPPGNAPAFHSPLGLEDQLQQMANGNSLLALASTIEPTNRPY